MDISQRAHSILIAIAKKYAPEHISEREEIGRQIISAYTHFDGDGEYLINKLEHILAGG